MNYKYLQKNLPIVHFEFIRNLRTNPRNQHIVYLRRNGINELLTKGEEFAHTSLHLG